MTKRPIMLRLIFAAAVGSAAVAAALWWQDERLLGLALFAGLAVRAPRPVPPRDLVEVDDDGVRRTLPDGSVEAVRWDALQRVGVMTTDEGPFTEDFFVILLGEDSTGCAVGGGQLRESGLVTRLGDLPGFDHEAFIRASGSCENATFPCWERPLP